MLKKVLLGLALVSFVGTASAQGLLIKRAARPDSKRSSFKLQAKDVNPSVLSIGNSVNTVPFASAKGSASSMMRKAPGATTWFQYTFTTSTGSCYVVGWDVFTQLASENTTDYNMAIIVPSRFATAVIDSITNVFYDASKISDCTLWISNLELDEEGYFSVPNEAQYADYHQAVSSSQIKGLNASGYLQSSDIALDTAFTVGENGCIIGLEFKATKDASPIVCGGTGESGGWYMKYIYSGESSWGDFSSNGNLAIGAHMDVSTCPTTNVTVRGIIETTFKAGEASYLPVAVNNGSYGAFENVSYVLTVDGNKEAEKTLTLDEDDQIDGGSNGYLYIPVTLTEGEHFVSVEVTKVDGETNTATTTSATGYALGLATVADRVSVVEEATSTACGYCPRGTVGLRKVKEALGDKVVALSIHGKQSNNYDDPMTCDDYSLYLSNFVSGYPSALIDRTASADPYVGLGIGSDWYETDAKGNLTKFKFALDKSVTALAEAYPSEGAISLTATLDGKTITANTTTTFTVDRETAPYSLVFVLTEDGMTGTDNGKNLWSQLNYYSQAFINAYYQKYGQDVSTYYIDSDMDEYKNGSYQYTETYNNVVVGAWGGQYSPIYGIAAFDGEDIIAGEAKTYSTTLDLSSNTLIQNFNHLSLAVLLLNDNNNQIVNAAQVKLVDPAGINGAVKDSKATEVARYSIDGRKLNAPVKGLNIVKMADGSSKTVLVK